MSNKAYIEQDEIHLIPQSAKSHTCAFFHSATLLLVKVICVYALQLWGYYELVSNIKNSLWS